MSPPQTTPKDDPTTERIGALDGVRAVAVLAVVLSHVGLAGFDGGGIGVLVFFVLSGFLITQRLLTEHDRTGALSLRNFYVRRVFRLFPAMALVVITTSVVGNLILRDGNAPLSAAVAVSFYYANWLWFAQGTGFDVLGYYGHLWSLSVEEQFYILWPVMMMWLTRVRARTVLVLLSCLSLASLALRVAFIQHPQDGHRLFATPLIFDQLLIGAALAVLVAYRPHRVAAYVSPLAWPAAVVLVVTVALRGSATSDDALVLNDTLVPTVIALASAVIIGTLATRPGSSLSALLSWPPLAFIGRISYSMYLWHILVIAAVTHMPIAALPRALVVVVVTTGVGAVSYYACERPFLKMRRSTRLVVRTSP